MLRRLRWFAASLVVLVALLVTGCGGGPASHPLKLTAVQTPFTGSVTKVCSGLTDTCVVKPKLQVQIADINAGDFAGSWGGVSGCKIPDVSSYQGTVNWDAAKPSICGAVFKGGEYKADPYAARNNSELARLHIWRAMYWFVRDRGCDTEGNQIISAARAYGIRVIANDIEVPEAYGYAHCLRVRELAAGFVVVTYGGSGTWPGGPGYGEGPLWQAEYGSILHPFWRPVVAWQCTDGVYGCATYIPGIGQDDVSVNLGLTSLGGPPPDPFAIFPRSPVNERSLILHYLGVRAHCTGYHRCFVGGHNLAAYLDNVLRPALKRSAARIAWLRFHVWHSWAANNGGSRFQYEINAAFGVAIKVG